VNQLWGIRQIKTGIKVQMAGRLKSLGVIVLAGILFIGSLFADALQSIAGHYMQDITDSDLAFTILFVNKIISLAIVTAWFTILFRYLPDGRPQWKVALTGGLVTAILFTIGKFVLRGLLPYKSISTVFGASGSFVLLLLFVFYSSFTLYFGACFTKIYALKKKRPIEPRHNAFYYEMVERKAENEYV